MVFTDCRLQRPLCFLQLRCVRCVKCKKDSSFLIVLIADYSLTEIRFLYFSPQIQLFSVLEQTLSSLRQLNIRIVIQDLVQQNPSISIIINPNLIQSAMQDDGHYNTFNTNSPYNEFQSSPSKTTDLYGGARAAFIRKVYSILSIQLIVTILFILLSIYSTSFFLFQIQNSLMLYLCIGVCFFIQIYIFCCNGGRTYPGNYILLGLFTLGEAYVVSFISSATGKESGNSVVLLAGIYTLAIVAALTAYACTTSEDFTTSTGIIIVLMVCMLILAITSFFIQSSFLTNLYCCLGVILFGLYLIIDTQMIVGGKSIELAIDQYALAALILYVDIVQIFMYLLRLLSKND